MRKTLWEAIIAVAVEEAVRFFIPILLPYVWFAIMVGLTWELLRWQPVHSTAIDIRALAKGGKTRVAFYVVAAIIGAGLGLLYWEGISKAFASLASREHESNAEIAKDIANLLPPPDPKPQAVAQTSQPAPATAPSNQNASPTPQTAIARSKPPQLPEAGTNWNRYIGKMFGPPTPPPQGFAEDPQGKTKAELAAMSKPDLAKLITDLTRRMRDYDGGWMGEGPRPPDSPSIVAEETPQHVMEEQDYQKRFKEWQQAKVDYVIRYRRDFQDQFYDDMLLIQELGERFPEVPASPECSPVFGNYMQLGQVRACADYLDKIVRRNLD